MWLQNLLGNTPHFGVGVFMPKKITSEQFIEKAKSIHGDKYDYSLVEYKDTHTKVKIICSKHGVFEQRPHTHLKIIGCSKCSRRSTTEEFIEKSKIIHSDKYDYSKVVYITTREKVTIICKKHGEFNQTPSSHLRGAGCYFCNRIDSNTQEFIEKSKIIHGDKYDYSLVDYKGTNYKIEIICKDHGVFKQTPFHHLKGQGCVECYHTKLTPKSFIERSYIKHGNKYDYSKVEETLSQSSVTIICPIHGEFIQNPYNHLQGQNCKICADTVSNTQEFIEKCKLIHSDKYDYSKVDYINNYTNVIIICKKHGEFSQIPSSHLSDCGCPKCGNNYSKVENKIGKWLENKNIKNISQYKFNNCVYKKKLPFDFYLPDYNICIEFDGFQHYTPIYGLKAFNTLIITDKIKTQFCFDNGIKLIRIPYWESGHIFQILEKELMLENNKIGT